MHRAKTGEPPFFGWLWLMSLVQPFLRACRILRGRGLVQHGASRVGPGTCIPHTL